MKHTIKLMPIICFFSLITYNIFAQTNDVTQYTFDQFKIGDNYGDMMVRPPYNALCDNDPVDHKHRRCMVYGGEICRNNAFPNKTTVVFYVKYADENKYNQPIEAFAYLYGSYFNNKTNFPLKPGDDLKTAWKQFGKEINSFDISGQEHSLKIYHFSPHIYTVSNLNKIVGFVIGAMPSDPKNEQWSLLMQMYERYTPKE